MRVRVAALRDDVQVLHQQVRSPITRARNTSIAYLTALLLIGVLFPVRPSSAADPSEAPYAVRDLGISGWITASNARGQLVGFSTTAEGERYAFLYTNGTMVNLGTLGGRQSEAYGINNRGQVVGWSDTAEGEVHAFLYTDGTMVDLGTLGGIVSRARGINKRGQVVGGSSTALTGDGPGHAFLYTGGTMVDLGTFGGSGSHAYGINNRGQVVGWSRAAGGESRAFLYTDGTMVDLGTLGGSDGFAYGINDRGEIVGVSTRTNLPQSRAFLYTDGTMVDLGTLGGNRSQAFSINNWGQVVGEADIEPAEQAISRPFLYANGTMRDLDSLLPPDSPRKTNNPFEWAIDDQGQIMGAFLMIPTFPKSPVLDNFDRSDGKLGKQWQGDRGLDSYKIRNNEVRVGDGGHIRWQSDNFGVDQEVFVTLAKVDPEGCEHGLLLKVHGDAADGPARAIEVLYDATAGAVRVRTKQPGQFDWTNYPDIPQSFADGDQFGARVYANGVVKAYRNRLPIGTVTLDAYDQQFFNDKKGRIGVWFDSAKDARLEDFGGGTTP